MNVDRATLEPRTRRHRPTLTLTLAGLAVLLLTLCAPQGGLAQVGIHVGARLAGVATHVADGDTLDVSTGGTTETVRLDGIDAPEGGQPFSAEARRQLRVLAFSQQVTVLVKDTDHYGRLVARVLVGSSDASEEMVRAGLAWHFTRYSSDRRLAQLEAAARARRAGLWADPSAVPPWTWRSRQRARPPSPSGQAPPRALPPDAAAVAPGPYHGNVSSGVYHAPPCRDYDCRNCTRVFVTREEAESAGFRPHRDCVFLAK